MRLYRSLPWVRISRTFGQLAEAEPPRPLVAAAILLYSAVFGCRIAEAAPASAWRYPSLAAFFRRRLGPGRRPLCAGARLVWPSDGSLTCAGQLGAGGAGVKGVQYSLATFLARPALRPEQLLQGRGTGLYQVVTYLAPGDYHRFHSPASWRCTSVTRLRGEQLSVAPPVLRCVPRLLQLNTRAVLAGSWQHGYFSLTAVGSTNVGSISIHWGRDAVDTSTNQARIMMGGGEQPC